MRLFTVNVGEKRTQAKGSELETTGIYKVPTSGMIPITLLGITQDFIGDPRHHGGPDQAIYIYGTKDYEWWAAEMGRPFEPGTFGENLTVTDLESASVAIGTRLHVGTVTLEVTAPRIPCSTLARRMADPHFALRYRQAEKPGLYCRVRQVGATQAGDEVSLEPFEGETISALEMFRVHFQRDQNAAEVRRILRAPISARARASLERALQRRFGEDPSGG